MYRVWMHASQLQPVPITFPENEVPANANAEHQWRNTLVECLGTFALVLAGCGAIAADQVSGGAVTHPGVALVFGAVVTVVIYSFGSISGAHINPAVSIAEYFRGNLSSLHAGCYILAQLAGGSLASIVTYLLLAPGYFETLSGETLNSAKLNLGVTLPFDGSWFTACSLEFLLTFGLMATILGSTRKEELRPFAPLAIGLCVMLEAMFAGPLCGASMNPARSIGPWFASTILQGETLQVGIIQIAYIVGPISGALSACALFSVLNLESE